MSRFASPALLLFLAGACKLYATTDKAYAPDVDLDNMVQHKSEVFESVFAKPELDLTPYWKVIIEPVTVNYDRNYDMREVDKAKVEEMKAYYRNTLVTEMAKGGYPTVQEPGPDVLKFVPHFTKLESSSSAVLVSFDTGVACMEMEIRDSQTDELLAAVSDRYEGRSIFAPAGGLGDAKEACRAWAKGFRYHLDQVHGRATGDLPGRPPVRAEPVEKVADPEQPESPPEPEAVEDEGEPEEQAGEEGAE